MLGIARAAQYAGWGTAPDAEMTTTALAVAQTLNPEGLAQPNWYADFLPITNGSGFNSVGALSYTGAAPSISMTGIGTDSRKGIFAITFQIGSTWFNDLTGLSDEQGFTFYQQIKPNAAAVFRNFDIYWTAFDTKCRMNMFGAPGLLFSPSEINAIRNKWVTVVVAYSSTSADFANFSPELPDPSALIQTRSMIMDNTTGALIKSADAPGSFGTDTFSLPQDYRLASGAFYEYSAGVNINDPVTTRNRNDIKLGGFWIAHGSTLDPLNYQNNFRSFARADTIGGIRAWANGRFDFATTTNLTAGGGVVYGRSIDVDNGDRLPNTDTTFQIYGSYTSPTPPSYVAL